MNSIPNEFIKLSTIRHRLLVLWMIFLVLIFALTFSQTIIGAYENHLKELWSWFLPTIFPTLALMIGSQEDPYDFEGSSPKTVYVRKSRSYTAIFFSAFYLSMVFLTSLCVPLATYYNRFDSSLDFLNTSQIWLAPLQGLVLISINFFFVKSQAVTKDAFQSSS